MVLLVIPLELLGIGGRVYTLRTYFQEREGPLPTCFRTQFRLRRMPAIRFASAVDRLSAGKFYSVEDRVHAGLVQPVEAFGDQLLPRILIESSFLLFTRLVPLTEACRATMARSLGTYPSPRPIIGPGLGATGRSRSVRSLRSAPATSAWPRSRRGARCPGLSWPRECIVVDVPPIGAHTVTETDPYCGR